VSVAFLLAIEEQEISDFFHKVSRSRKLGISARTAEHKWEEYLPQSKHILEKLKQFYHLHCSSFDVVRV